MNKSIPFEEIFKSFVTPSAHLVRAQLETYDIKISENCLRCFVQDAAMRVANVASATYYWRYQASRSYADNILSAMMSASIDDSPLPHEKYDTFCQRSLGEKDGFQSSLGEDIYTIMTSILTDWKTSILIAFNRMHHDWPRIAQLAGNRSRNIPLITGFTRKQADTHYEGHASAIIELGESKIIYKAKPVVCDLLFQKTIKCFDQEYGNVVCKLPITIDCRTYGWQQFIHPISKPTKAGARSYFKRCGNILFVAWLCSGSDCHGHNIIASNGGPVIIDCETFFHGVMPSIDKQYDRKSLGAYFANELRTIGFFPIIDDVDDDVGLENLPVFCDGREYRAICPVTGWKYLGTDYISPYRKHTMLCGGSSQYEIDGIVQNPKFFLSYIIEGFFEYRSILFSERGNSIVNMISESAEGKIGLSRIILRDTQVYDSFIRGVFDHVGMNPTEDPAELLQSLLARSPITRHAQSLLKYEQQHLIHGYIPRFWLESQTGRIIGDDQRPYLQISNVISVKEIINQRAEFIRKSSSDADLVALLSTSLSPY